MPSRSVRPAASSPLAGAASAALGMVRQHTRPGSGGDGSLMPRETGERPAWPDSANPLGTRCPKPCRGCGYGRRVRRREGGHSQAGRPGRHGSRRVRRSRPCGRHRARYGGAVRAWAGANRHAGVLGRVTARRSLGMSAFWSRGSRFVMTSFPFRRATAPRDRSSFMAVLTDLGLAPIHRARSASLRLTGSPSAPSSSTASPSRARQTSSQASGPSRQCPRPLYCSSCPAAAPASPLSGERQKV